MAQKETDKSHYDSKWGGGKITAAQFIMELLCEKIATWRKKTLTNKFWLEKEWKQTYILQMLHVNALLKVYPEQVIITSIKRVEKLTSIKVPWFQNVLKEEYDKWKLKQKIEKVEIKTQPTDVQPVETIIVSKPKRVGNNIKEL